MNPKSAHQSYRKLSAASHPVSPGQWILIFALSAILLATSLFLVFTQVISLYSPAKYNSPQTTLLNHPTPIQNQTTDTSKWKTYINTKTGYSIKYPIYLNHSRQTYNGIGGKVTVDKWTPLDENYAIYVHSYDESVNPRLEFNAITQSDEKIQIANQNVKKLTGTEVISGNGTLIHIGPVKNKGQNYMLIYSSGSKTADRQSLSTFDQILSTFKFE